MQAFRKAACVAEERAQGFTHSHNDTFNWCAHPACSVVLADAPKLCLCLNKGGTCQPPACAGTNSTSTSGTAHDERHIGSMLVAGSSPRYQGGWAAERVRLCGSIGPSVPCKLPGKKDDQSKEVLECSLSMMSWPGRSPLPTMDERMECVPEMSLDMMLNS